MMEGASCKVQAEVQCMSDNLVIVFISVKCKLLKFVLLELFASLVILPVSLKDKTPLERTREELRPSS